MCHYFEWRINTLAVCTSDYHRYMYHSGKDVCIFLRCTPLDLMCLKKKLIIPCAKLALTALNFLTSCIRQYERHLLHYS